MYQLHGTIRDYDPTTDTASVELTSTGTIDTWLDGVNVASNVDRAYLAYGAQCMVSTPDEHRLDQLVVVQVTPPVAYQGANTTGALKTEYGRTYVQANGSGAASVSVTFPTSFTSAPTVHTAGDNNQLWDISAITTTGFTATLHTATTPNAWVYVTWTATGN